ncbi:MAG: hypothetical protein AAB641_00205 [Patescibacteria group bacterium]
MLIQKQKQLELECIDGRCPPNIDLVKEIVLTSLEKKAIFFTLKKHIETLKPAGFNVS